MCELKPGKKCTKEKAIMVAACVIMWMEVIS